MNPLQGFDFSCLADPSFREDDVREEIIAPILRALGYRHRGRFRVERSKNLKHPFIMLGSRKRWTRIVPDYTLFIDKKAVLVLDAKSPSEDVISLEHQWQAYSYAIHPEVKCYRYGVCNGKRLIIFGKSSWKPEADVAINSSDDAWTKIGHVLGTDGLAPEVDDLHTSWFYLLGALLSPNTAPAVSGNAAYRLSWYMPSVDGSRKAAAQAAMANLTDSELITVLKAGAYLYTQLDGTPAEHVGYMLSYDKNIVGRLRSMLEQKKIPVELEDIASQMAFFLGQKSEVDE